MEMNGLLVDSLGWLGSFLLVLAYFQNSRNKLSAQSATYQLLNVVGSLLLIINTIYYGAYPSSAVNIVWVIIGALYLIKIKKRGE